MNQTIARALLLNYRIHGIDAEYNGQTVRVMRDTYITTENEKQKALRIRSSDVPTMVDASGNIQLVVDEINGKRILSWEYHGNEREEIIFIIESDGRGN